MANRFLTAEWKNLIMANYVVDPEILAPYIPAHTELDFWDGKCMVSLVGFLFDNTKVFGISVPSHTSFEEVNLRFYVRYKENDEWRRGVVFIKEIVPKQAISWVANRFYNENYITLPMRHSFYKVSDKRIITYEWQVGRMWNDIQVKSALEPIDLIPGSEESFITEHYWGYTRINNQKTSEYQVEHPSWRIFPVYECRVNCSAIQIYGDRFRFIGSREPDSVFMAEGSKVTVRSKRILPNGKLKNKIL